MMVEYKCFQWQENTVKIHAVRSNNATAVIIAVEPPIDQELHITAETQRKRLRGGMALCHPNDTYCFETGVKMACRNALNISNRVTGLWWPKIDAEWERQLYSAIRKALKGSDNA
jgi:hypothetical protein